MEKGSFRADLFYRLNVVPFQLPALREHLEDIPLLIEHFNQLHSRKNNLRAKKFTDEAIDLMQNYNWPGNVRELSALIERIIIMQQKTKIEADDLGLRKMEMGMINYNFNSYREASEAYEREFITRKLTEFQGYIS